MATIVRALWLAAERSQTGALLIDPAIGRSIHQDWDFPLMTEQTKLISYLLWKVWTQESFQKVEFDRPGERSPE